MFEEAGVTPGLSTFEPIWILNVVQLSAPRAGQDGVPFIYFILCNLDCLSFACEAGSLADFNKAFSEFLSFVLNIMKVKTQCVCLQSITARCSSSLLPALCSSTNTPFSTSCLRICTCLILTSHFLPLTALYMMSNLVYPRQEVVSGLSLTDFHLWEPFLSPTEGNLHAWRK